MRPGLKWWLAGLVTVVVFMLVTLLFTNVVVPLWSRDSGVQLGWGFGAGTAAAALAALWGKSYASPVAEHPASGGGQTVDSSEVVGGITQVLRVGGGVKITHRGADPSPFQAPTSLPARTASAAGPPEESGQRVSGTTAAGPLDQVQGIEGNVEIEQ